VTDLEYSAAVVGVVHTLRQRWPGIDGLRVTFLTLVVACLIVIAYGTAGREELTRQAIRVFLLVTGGTSMVGYSARKLGVGIKGP